MKPSALLHFHNGHSLEVWCGRRSTLSNWTTIAAWVTCRKCLRIMAAKGGADLALPPDWKPPAGRKGQL